jgi:benzodiazapine receptor
VWLTLYTMMGVAAWLVWRTAPGESRTHALTWFGIQLVLNAAWTPVFFGLGEVGAGLVVLAAIVVAVLGTVIQFGKRSQLAAWLMVPYLAWVSFALCLNAALWWLNR